MVPLRGHRDFRVDRQDPELARDMARPASEPRVAIRGLYQGAFQSDAVKSATAAFDFGHINRQE